VAVRDGAATVAYGIHARRSQRRQVYDLRGCAVQRHAPAVPVRHAPGRHPAASQPSADIHAYRQVLGAPLRFDSMQAGLVLPVRWLDRPVADADALLHRLIEDRATVVMTRVDPLLHNEVRRVLRGALMRVTAREPR